MANEISTFRASRAYIQNDGERIQIKLDGVKRIVIEVPSSQVQAVLADDTTFMAASDCEPVVKTRQYVIDALVNYTLDNLAAGSEVDRRRYLEQAARGGVRGFDSYTDAELLAAYNEINDMGDEVTIE